MRTIIFRGKDKNGRWVYGDLFSITTEQGNKGFFIIVENTSETDESIPDNSICFEHGKDCFYIDPETVGQFTGLYDKNGKEIYEGDIIETRGNNFIYKIIYNEKSAAFIGVRDSKVFGVLDLYETDVEYRKIIGNIHDGKE